MLTLDQAIPATIFVALVAFVYVHSARNLLLSLICRIRQVEPRRQSWLSRVTLWLSLLGIPCFAYGFLVEPYWPEVVRVELRTPKLSAAQRSIRIVHISDIHSDAQPRLEDRLPMLIVEQRPDIILFSGDSTNSPDGIPIFKKLLPALARIAPTYVVRGNWDWSDGLFDGTGAIELSGSIDINIGDARIWLAGTSPSRPGDIPRLLSQVPSDRFSIFLYHYPDEIYAAVDKVDLYCAGHTHGGQVALPVYGALITLSRYGKRFESGLHQVGQTHLYVNRGVGMEGGLAPRVRFFARPEITVYEVRSAS